MVEKESILIVEKGGDDRNLLERLLMEEYEIVMADDGKQALSDMYKRRNELAAVVLDWEISVVSAYQILQVMQARGMLEEIPVFVTTTETDPEIDKKVYGLDVKAIIRKPYDEVVVRRQILDRLRELAEKTKFWQEGKDYKQLVEENKKKLDGYYDSLLDAIGTLMEYRVSESDRHVKRIKGFARIMAVAYRNQFPDSGLDENKIKRIVRGSAIHDIGKVAVPDSILLSPAKLTDDERQILRSHTTRGEEIMQLLKDVQGEEQFRVSCEICRWHHERHDGSGYPDGLEGDEIPLSAQIVSIVDVYDELVSERISKKPYDKETAYRMIVNGECGAFAPELLKCFEASKKLLELFSDSN